MSGMNRGRTGWLNGPIFDGPIDHDLEDFRPWIRDTDDGTVEVRRWSEMTKILIAYRTIEGQTARIAEYVAGVVRDQGYEAQAVDIKQSKDVSLDSYDAVIVGSSVHMGKHGDDIADFVRKSRVTLERLPSAFFSVSLAAYGDMDNARAYVENFEEETGWHPDQIGYLSGALLYRQYGIVKRWMMKRIVRDKPGGLSMDTSRDWVYTDWDEVKHFVEEFLPRLAPQNASKIKS
jgi:menaquinone-dependent protoporphyrinogen oxidase